MSQRATASGTRRVSQTGEHARLWELVSSLPQLPMWEKRLQDGLALWHSGQESLPDAGGQRVTVQVQKAQAIQ